MIVNPKIEDKFDVIVLAGQSNAESSGLGETEKPYEPKEDIVFLSGGYFAKVRSVEYGNDYLELSVSDEYRVKVAAERELQGRYAAVLALPFADEYRKNDLAAGRKILVVNAPIGGTGFAKGHWGKGEILFERMMNMTREAVAMNPENRVVAFLWHQGEHDSFENAGLNYTQRKQKYENDFFAVLSEVRREFGNVPAVAAGFTDGWYGEYAEQCRAIYDATEAALEKAGNGAFIRTQGLNLKCNDEEVHNGDKIHFSRDSIYKLSSLYYKEFEKLKKENI